jgi:hypothetical protein
MNSRRMSTIIVSIATFVVVGALPSIAWADFGLTEPSVSFADGSGNVELLAGSHPYSTTIHFGLNEVAEGPKVFPDGSVKDVISDLPPGFAADATATPRCAGPEFAQIVRTTSLPACPDSSAVGIATVKVPVAPGEAPGYFAAPLYNLIPGPGHVLKLGFVILDVPITIEGGLTATAPYRAYGAATNISQAVSFFGSSLTLWGNPADPRHDTERGSCVNSVTFVHAPGEVNSTGSCPYGGSSEKPFTTMPTGCGETLLTTLEADSWQMPDPSSTTQATAESPSLEDCADLPLEARSEAQPTVTNGESSTGLNFSLDVSNPGLSEADGRSGSAIKKVVVTLPEGFTTNPAVAEGLGTCTLAEYEEESLGGQGGCPASSKLGTVEVESQLLEKETEGGSGVSSPVILPGKIFIARQRDNVFEDLLTIYMVIEEPEMGIFIKLPGRVEPDPSTGRLTTTFGEPGHELPQLPFSAFRLHFRGGERAPLVTPAACGTYTTETLLYPYANPTEPVRGTSAFNITAGAGSSSCAPTPSQLPDTQSFSAGTLSSKAGAYSPFVLKLARDDGTQQFRSISATLPEGLLGRLAGIPYCTDADIAQAQARGGEGQGALEQADPSCPQASEVGTVTASAGSGSEPLYVSGHAYLAGPYAGAPLSLEIITPAIAGPFDLGVVAIRTALQVDPLTAQITATSDAIPSILHGLPLDLRSIALQMGRPEFTLNPTSCEPKSITGSVTSTFGSASHLSQFFQASDCEALKFSPSLSLKLKGATGRTGNPGVIATLTQPAGQAGISEVSTVLPRYEFIDNAHINNPCTRVQYAANACPPKSVLGTAKAWSPLLERPLEGPVYFRSNGGERKLPDLVADLNGQIHVELVGFIDSVRPHGAEFTRIRTRFLTVPDAPVSRFRLELYGGKRGLLENNTDLCKVRSVAAFRMSGQNGLPHDYNHAVSTSCKRRSRIPRHGATKAAK